MIEFLFKLKSNILYLVTCPPCKYPVNSDPGDI